MSKCMYANHEPNNSCMIICLLLECWGRGPLVYVALKPSAVAHVIRMRIPEPTESGERGQMSFPVSVVVVGGPGRVIRRRWPRRRSKSSGNPTAARQRTCMYAEYVVDTRQKNKSYKKKKPSPNSFLKQQWSKCAPPPFTNDASKRRQLYRQEMRIPLKMFDFSLKRQYHWSHKNLSSAKCRNMNILHVLNFQRNK